MAEYQDLNLSVVAPTDDLIVLHKIAVGAHNDHMEVTEHARGLTPGSKGRVDADAINADSITDSPSSRSVNVSAGELFVHLDYDQNLFTFHVESKYMERELRTIPGYHTLLAHLRTIQWPDSPQWGGVERLSNEDPDRDEPHVFVTNRFGPAGDADPSEDLPYRLLS